MYERERVFQSALSPSTLQPTERLSMQSQVKNAVVTTAIVLTTIFVLNKITFTRGLVQQALA